MRFWEWLGQHDRDYAALRRAARTAIVMPGLFAVGDKVEDAEVWLGCDDHHRV